MTEPSHLSAGFECSPPDQGDERLSPRTCAYGPQRLSVDYQDSAGSERRMEALLWDFSEGGLGMDSSQPISVDTVIGIEGDLYSPDLALSFEAKARVTYCRRIEVQHFRIGVAFLEVKFQRPAAAANSNE